MIKRWSHTWNWAVRLDAWLREVDRVEQLRIKRETFEARQRWTEHGRTMQDLGMQKLVTVNPAKIPTEEARRLVCDGATLESRGLGLDSRQPLQITNQTANIQIDPERAREIVERFLARSEREKKQTATVEVQHS